MKLLSVRWIAPAALLCACAGGCAKNAPPKRVATRPAETAPSVDASSPGNVRVREISSLSSEYSELSVQLPGRTVDEHRQIMRKVFGKLDQILELLADPRSDLVFRQQLLVLEDAGAQLGTGVTDVSVDPTIDTGLMSGYKSLLTIAHGKDFDGADLASAFADFKTRLDELDTVRGLAHQVVVAEAVQASGVVISKMAEFLASHIPATPESGPATSPSTLPATESALPNPTEPSPPLVPATAPAPGSAPSTTAPATVPATQP